jgi:CubicO group peptidase (beta-lactamase class C family)
MPKRIARILLALVLATTRIASSQSSDLAEKLAKIEKEIEEKRKQLGVPGVAVAIVKDDKVIFQKGFGWRDVERKLPVTADTLFAIGSCTKAFTAMAAVISQDTGKLSLDDSPKKHLAYFKLQDTEADAKITVRNLLDHSSGLMRSDLVALPGVLNREEVIKVAGLAKPTAKLREKFQYQNTMYSAAGEVVAKANGTTWEKFIGERIFKPLGMKSSNTSIKEMSRASDHATGYWLDDKIATKAPFNDLRNIAAAGAINSNVKDMAQWIRLMLGDGVFEGKRLVSEKGYMDIVTRHMKMGDDGYGLGWALGTRNGHPVIAHGGGVDGFNSLVELMPDQKLGFVVLINAPAQDGLAYMISSAVYDNLVEKPETPTAAPPPVPPPTANLPQYKELIDQYEVGDTHLEITTKEDRVVLIAPGQPTFTLIEKEKDHFGFVELPDSYRAIFKRGAAGEITGFSVKEAFGDSEIKRLPPSAKSDLTVDELMVKTIAAAGGEANLRKHRSVVTTTVGNAENQGLIGRSVVYAQAPNLKTTITAIAGLGKKIATVREYFDGTQGGSEINSRPPERHKDGQLADVRTRSAFYELLNWKTLYKTVTIKRKAKVGDEEVYVVAKTPEKGTTITDYYSAKSFLLVKREQMVGADDEQELTVDTYSDYRNVDGEMIPFSVVTEDAGLGRIVGKVIEVKFNVNIPANTFRPATK